MDDVSIFICAHKPIDTPLPNNDFYTIIAQNRSVKSEIHKVIYIDDDEFTKTHWRCYSEGCAIRYLYNHPELLKDYVGIAHYRRFLKTVIDNPESIKDLVNTHGAIVAPIIKFGLGKTSVLEHHPKPEGVTFIETVKEVIPEYNDIFEEFLNTNGFHVCNIFVMKKEDFLEMCEMCFKVLDAFDKKANLKNNKDVLLRCLKRQSEGYFNYPNTDLIWHSRLQGFYLEYLTHMYYIKKWGEDKIYTSDFYFPHNCFNNIKISE